ncbi:MAG: hypothetical protein VXW49_18085, partial [Pseudomonadota bacterium]|nr:hypothetical protein [Pseudomonadota bacterium]
VFAARATSFVLIHFGAYAARLVGRVVVLLAVFAALLMGSREQGVHQQGRNAFNLERSIPRSAFLGIKPPARYPV